MNLLETFRIALTALGTNKLRALLTTLGIMIGVASVVSLTSLGGSLQNYISGQFESLGADILQISSARFRGTSSGTVPLTTTDAAGIADPSVAPHIAAVATTYSVQGTVRVGENGDALSIQGVSANYAEVNEWHPGSGRFITQDDVDSSARVALIDQTTAEDMFGTTNPVGQTMLINGQVFTVVGVMEERSTSGFSSQTVLIPIATAQTRLTNVRVAGRGYRVSSIQAKVVASDAATVELATEEVEAYLLRAHGITDPDSADFDVRSSSTILESLSSTLSLVTLFLSVIAGISLLVGGIGVMNIMLVSVTERTREIGLRKAVGAQYRSILSQFLFESILLALLGGAVGMTLATVILFVAGQLVSEFSISITPESALLAVGISSLIGVLSGLYPANRAAQMRPIDALRFE